MLARKTGFTCKWDENSRIQDIWPLLVSHEKRNLMIVNDVMDAIKQGRMKTYKTLGYTIEEKQENVLFP